jgi:carboxylesterase type B
LQSTDPDLSQVGAFGYLAGDTMEKQGLPNAALWDQRAVFEWIQKYIHYVGGDSKQVSAWGESAGAASIVHHLVLEGGTVDPLFTRALLESPAFPMAYDRRGRVEENYRVFERNAGCAGKGIQCLRKQSSSVLNAANNKTLAEALPFGFPFTFVPDGKTIRQLPALEFAAGE